MPYTLSLHNSFDRGLESLWRELELCSNPYVFQTYDWNAYWYSRVGVHGNSLQLCIVVVSSGGKPVALFPIGICVRYGFRTMEFLGGYLSDYNAPLFQHQIVTKETLKEIWRCVESVLPRHDLLRFSRMPGLIEDKKNLFVDILEAKRESISHSANLNKGWDCFSEKLPERFKKDNARMRRRLSELGVLKFKVIDEAGAFSKVIDQLLELKERRYIETGVRNILANAGVRRFYEQSFSLNGASVKPHLAGLFLNDKLIAGHWGLLYANRYYYLVPCYATGQWAKYSPGRLLLENLVEWSAKNNIEIFDFTVGGEAYKDIWCDLEMHLYGSYKGKNFKGWIGLIILNAIKYAKTNGRVRGLITSIFKIVRKS